MEFSVIIPTYKEENIDEKIRKIKQKLPKTEIIVVDSSPNGKTFALAEKEADKVVKTKKQSRGFQLKLGLKKATGDVIIFTHADIEFPENVKIKLEQCFSNKDTAYAAFCKKFRSDSFLLKLLATLNNTRSKLTSYIQGDNVLIVRKKALSEIGGVPEKPIMEDLILSKKLKKYAKQSGKQFQLIDDCVSVSARYFKENGIMYSIAKMQLMKFLFLLGVSTKRLKNFYYN